MNHTERRKLLASRAQLGSTLIAIERKQHAAKGYDAAHDAQHGHGELVTAAMTYVDAARMQLAGLPVIHAKWQWPWEPESFKPAENPIVTLAKAGALIAAAMDQIARENPELLG